MAAVDCVLENLGLSAVARGSAGLVLRNLDRAELRAVHAQEVEEVAGGPDHGDVQFPIVLLGLRFGGTGDFLRLFERDRGALGNIERHLLRHRGRRLLCLRERRRRRERQSDEQSSNRLGHGSSPIWR